MKRYCANCNTPISAHVLVVDGRDFHRKSCYCYFAGHKVEGDRSKPKACRKCEPPARVPGGASRKLADGSALEKRRG